MMSLLWRKGRDSNPRCLAALLLSKQVHLSALPPFQDVKEPYRLSRSTPGGNRTHIPGLGGRCYYPLSYGGKCAAELYHLRVPPAGFEPAT